MRQDIAYYKKKLYYYNIIKCILCSMDVILSIFSSDSFVNSQEWTLSRSVPDIRYVCQDWEAGGWGGSIETCWCWGCLSSLEPLSQFVDTHIRLGIVGSLSSGKSALVHRYLTGSYMQVSYFFKIDHYINLHDFDILKSDTSGGESRRG